MLGHSMCSPLQLYLKKYLFCIYYIYLFCKDKTERRMGILIHLCLLVLIHSKKREKDSLNVFAKLRKERQHTAKPKDARRTASEETRQRIGGQWKERKKGLL